MGRLGHLKTIHKTYVLKGVYSVKEKNVQHPDRKVPDHIQIKHDQYNLANVNDVKLSQHHTDKISLVKKFCSGPVTGPQTAV